MARVLVTFKVGFKENSDAILRHFQPDRARAQSQDVSVVVLPREPRVRRIAASSRAQVAMPVRGHCNTDPGAADQDTPRYSTFGHDSGKGIGEIRVVNRIGAIRSEIKYR